MLTDTLDLISATARVSTNFIGSLVLIGPCLSPCWFLMVMVMMDLYLQKSHPQKMASILPSSALIAPGASSIVPIVTTATSVVAGTAFVIAHGLGRPEVVGGIKASFHFPAVEGPKKNDGCVMWVSKAFGYVILYDYCISLYHAVHKSGWVV